MADHNDPNRPRTAAPVRDAIVLGAGPVGLTTALLLSRAGYAVAVLDRDPDNPPSTRDRVWDEWERPGVKQFQHIHIALPRWYHVMQQELPEVITALRRLGGSAVNLLHLNPDSATGGWQPGDERYTTVTGRRPILEAALARVADAEPGLTIHRGRRVTGLISTREASGEVRVVGVRLADEVIEADLVIDACGRRTPVPGWLAPLGAAPVVEQAPSGLSYYSRYYTAPGGPPLGTGPALVHHESYSLLTLPADEDVWSVAVVVGAADRPTRALQDTQTWEVAARACGVPDGWLAGTPITGIRPFGGLRDVVRDYYATGGRPVVQGLLAVGDAWATTNPFLGRGLSLGAIQAVVLRDAVTDEAEAGPRAVSARYAALLKERAEPYVRATIGFGRHRVAQMAAEATGRTYVTDDPAWAASTALAAGLLDDPVLLRAYQEIGCVLALPSDVFADPALRARLGPWFGRSPYPSDRPGRAALLDALDRTPSHLSHSHPSRPLEGALS